MERVKNIDGALQNREICESLSAAMSRRRKKLRPFRKRYLPLWIALIGAVGSIASALIQRLF